MSSYEKVPTGAQTPAIGADEEASFGMYNPPKKANVYCLPEHSWSIYEESQAKEASVDHYRYWKRIFSVCSIIILFGGLINHFRISSLRSSLQAEFTTFKESTVPQYCFEAGVDGATCYEELTKAQSFVEAVVCEVMNDGYYFGRELCNTVHVQLDCWVQVAMNGYNADSTRERPDVNPAGWRERTPAFLVHFYQAVILNEKLIYHRFIRKLLMVVSLACTFCSFVLAILFIVQFVKEINHVSSCKQEDQEPDQR
ncbi:hypothetical protein FT663_01997 [Candidozyma haemuli var. vulneris]|uniref:Uncharacterized protein n=1 Tax=Candidozyma haemuli TaxID=45357 RepID=A0A2V1AM73_9ASCO|nr:hypothetical protein CXQ85_001230 [[Candida] haemuloni]KAF3991871.1 hypothetical protein FT662_01488 [[Candida] haemuloni var. vulneris]KAF3993166.1 hypothetical protein FT663_01997 [[Candida] haemuloni var. vulneris]PVH18938.1 hypothetical protein CXQ85_001230 [[Candida] haemuloni]